ncbi:MAG: esterase/lipase family protein, partial [Acidimicrobiales bacterium]
PPPPLPERRMAVLVDGLGSSSGHTTIGDLDTAALGYQPDDVIRFSYRGGTTDEQPYGASDTTVDLRTSARRLRALLEQAHRDHPGVPVDLIGHSQGGIVARTLLAYEYDTADPRLPRVATLVTVASPHQGADIATALAMASHTSSGELIEWGLSATGVSPVDLRGDSVRQLSETSRFLAKLNRRALPDGVRVTSIGTRGDLMVPAVHTRLAGASNVVVSVPGVLTEHGRLPGSESAHREVALAVAGLPPTCQTLTDMLVDAVVSDLISTAEDGAGAAAYFGSRRVDSGAKSTLTIPKERRR